MYLNTKISITIYGKLEKWEKYENKAAISNCWISKTFHQKFTQIYNTDISKLYLCS